MAPTQVVLTLSHHLLGKRDPEFRSRLGFPSFSGCSHPPPEQVRLSRRNLVPRRQLEPRFSEGCYLCKIISSDSVSLRPTLSHLTSIYCTPTVRLALGAQRTRQMRPRSRSWWLGAGRTLEAGNDPECRPFPLQLESLRQPGSFYFILRPLCLCSILPSPVVSPFLCSWYSNTSPCIC